MSSLAGPKTASRASYRSFSSGALPAAVFVWPYRARRLHTPPSRSFISFAAEELLGLLPRLQRRRLNTRPDSMSRDAVEIWFGVQCLGLGEVFLRLGGVAGGQVHDAALPQVRADISRAAAHTGPRPQVKLLGGKRHLRPAHVERRPSRFGVVHHFALDTPLPFFSVTSLPAIFRSAAMAALRSSTTASTSAFSCLSNSAASESAGSLALRSKQRQRVGELVLSQQRRGLFQHGGEELLRLRPILTAEGAEDTEGTAGTAG